MKMNPTAIAFWACAAGIGFLIAGTITGAVAGLTVALGISVLSDILG